MNKTTQDGARLGMRHAMQIGEGMHNASPKTTNTENMKTKTSKVLKVGNAAFTTKQEMIDTLFQPINGKTAAGFYKKRARGVLFSRPSGEPWFFLVANKWGERFFVSCGQVGGRVFYMHALSQRDEETLGIEKLKYSESHELAESIWNEINQ